MALELVPGAVLQDNAVNTTAFDHPPGSTSAARTVFLFDNAFSKLAHDLHLYTSYFDHDWTQAAHDFQQTLQSARSIVQECQQLKDRSGGVFHPMQRFRLGKKVIKLREQIRQFMLHNRLRILAACRLEALESGIEIRLAEPDEEDAELLAKISEEVKKVREEMQSLSGEKRENTAKIMDLMRRMNDDPSSEENAAATGSRRYATSRPLPSTLVLGLDEHVQRLKRMLLLSGDEANSKKVTIVGGMGGIGKTTLALAVCHDRQVKDFFRQTIHFVTVSRNPDMVALLSNIWMMISDNKSLPHFENVDDAYTQLCCQLEEDMPPSSKCLLVLDDVWSTTNLEKLIFDIPGFRTLVTATQAQELETIRFETQTYEMECLDPKNARRLFCYWTFGQEDIPSWADETLVEEVISECKGTPLALKVIAGSLSSAAKHIKQECVWRQTRDKLRQAEQEEGYRLAGRLRTSVDALDAQLRECFKDLGAFPENADNPVDNVLDIWVHVRGMDWDDAYCALVELASRCLLDLATSKPRSSFSCKWDGDLYTSPGDLSEYGYGGCLRISQHHVMRDVAIQLSMENLPVRHRSWLLMPHPQPHLPDEWQSPISLAARVISISCTDYRASRDWPTLLFPNAEALLLYDVHNELPLFVISMPQLKVLVVRRSSAVGRAGWTTHPTFRPCIQGLPSLQSLYIDQGGGAIYISTHHAIHGLALASELYQRLIAQACLRGQRVYRDGNGLHIGGTLCDITRTTGILCVPKPRKVMVSGLPLEIKCNDMVEMASLASSLDILKLTSGTLPEQYLLQLANLKVLVVPEFPTKVSLFSSCELNNLKALIIESLSNASLVCKLKSLEVLEILDCSLLEKLPGDVGQLQCLRRLVLVGLDKLKKLPLSMGQLGCLKELRLKGASMLEDLPESLVELGNLETLELSSCYRLKRLPHNIGKLQCLKAINLCKAQKLEELPESLVELGHLQRLNLSGCQRLTHLPHNIGQLQSLREIDVRGTPLDELSEESLADQEWRHLILRD